MVIRMGYDISGMCCTCIPPAWTGDAPRKLDRFGLPLSSNRWKKQRERVSVSVEFTTKVEVR